MMQQELPRYCLKCRYNLYGLPLNRCPECGRDFDPGNPQSFADSPYRTRWLFVPAARRIYFLALLISCAVAFVSHLSMSVGTRAVAPVDVIFGFSSWLSCFPIILSICFPPRRILRFVSVVLLGLLAILSVNSQGPLLPFGPHGTLNRLISYVESFPEVEDADLSAYTDGYAMVGLSVLFKNGDHETVEFHQPMLEQKYQEADTWHTHRDRANRVARHVQSLGVPLQPVIYGTENDPAKDFCIRFITPGDKIEEVWLSHSTFEENCQQAERWFEANENRLYRASRTREYVRSLGISVEYPAYGTDPGNSAADFCLLEAVEGKQDYMWFSRSTLEQNRREADGWYSTRDRAHRVRRYVESLGIQAYSLGYGADPNKPGAYFCLWVMVGGSKDSIWFSNSTFEQNCREADAWHAKAGQGSTRPASGAAR